jgi:hypothetical protein
LLLEVLMDRKKTGFLTPSTLSSEATNLVAESLLILSVILKGDFERLLRQLCSLTFDQDQSSIEHQPQPHAINYSLTGFLDPVALTPLSVSSANS